ncbi:hypothetical protein BDY21DRAFT_140270 [Lineolata rhizophorae]|uniref:Uncharacterized protein n=1 Tax=Lineolata rhizophorae TaxID=578093 RepID=A0A6A6PB08_9PEZI|nr:hypothetical protein BDY21DRAFT_140270 [Lineolata rhizophorae]
MWRAAGGRRAVGFRRAPKDAFVSRTEAGRPVGSLGSGARSLRPKTCCLFGVLRRLHRQWMLAEVGPFVRGPLGEGGLHDEALGGSREVVKRVKSVRGLEFGSRGDIQGGLERVCFEYPFHFVGFFQMRKKCGDQGPFVFRLFPPSKFVLTQESGSPCLERLTMAHVHMGGAFPWLFVFR